MAIEKLKTRKINGIIEEYFQFLDKGYVRTRIDPEYRGIFLPKVYNNFSNIKNPLERILVVLVSEMLYDVNN